MEDSDATTAGAGADARVERYRRAERELWQCYDLHPGERFVELESPAVRLRVLEQGTGEPVLFVHGTAGPGTFPPLISRLSGFRCLVLDRPGWGLSSRIDYSNREFGPLLTDVLTGVLDGLEIERAHVIGASFGNIWVLRLAQRQPSRVSRIALLGGAPLTPEIRVPPFVRLLSAPVGGLMLRLPLSPKSVQRQLRQMGHGASLDDGRIPDELIQWRLALERETDSMRAERDMLRSVVSLRKGFKPGLQFEDGELSAIAHETLYVYGTRDDMGTLDTWQRLVDLLPRAELEVMQAAGHMPWLDDPTGVAGHVNRHLGR